MVDVPDEEGRMRVRLTEQLEVALCWVLPLDVRPFMRYGCNSVRWVSSQLV